MSTIDNAAIAKQLGYTKEQMIAKFGNPGEKTPQKIGSILNLSNDSIFNIFGSKPIKNIHNNGSTEKNNGNNAAIAKQLGYTKEQMISKFGNPGEKTTQKIGLVFSTSKNKSSEILGSKSSVDTFESSSSAKTKDDKYEQVANALGYDALSVSAVMKAVANKRASGNIEKVVPQLAKDLGLPITFVSNVLTYLKNNNN